MISIQLSKLANILNGELFGSDNTVNTISIDSRKIIKGCLFIALTGKNYDAHNFIVQAQKTGASALLVNSKFEKINIPQVIVKDTRLAFGKLASWVRKQTSVRIVALTGSTGKTTVKEMTAEILRQCGHTLCTVGNLNNDIGVSITLSNLTKEYDYAVIELGANHSGEIARTVNLTNPEAVLVNNIAEAHIEGFSSLQGVAKAKGEIYSGLPSNGIAIVNADSSDWLNWKHIVGLRKTWYFSLSEKYCDFIATNIQEALYNTKFTLQTPIGNIDVLLPLLGRHNVSNALAAAALSIAVDAPLTAVKQGLETVKPIPGRLFLISLADHKLLIDDSYNANISSMAAAIKVLSAMPGYRIMVVGDMAELGEESTTYHARVGKFVKLFDIDRILSVGKFSQILSKESGIGEHFANKVLLIKRLKILLREHSFITVLVKGSRDAAMEEIVNALKEEVKYVGLDS